MERLGRAVHLAFVVVVLEAVAAVAKDPIAKREQEEEIRKIRKEADDVVGNAGLLKSLREGGKDTAWIQREVPKVKAIFTTTAAPAAEVPWLQLAGMPETEDRLKRAALPSGETNELHELRREEKLQLHYASEYGRGDEPAEGIRHEFEREEERVKAKYSGTTVPAPAAGAAMRLLATRWQHLPAALSGTSLVASARAGGWDDNGSSFILFTAVACGLAGILSALVRSRRSINLPEGGDGPLLR